MIDLVLSNIVIIPKTIYIYSTDSSNYSYNEEELLYSDDHLLQLANDIVLANLDKVEHTFERIYDDIKVGDTYWLVRDDVLPLQIIITDVSNRLDSRDDNIVVEEVVKYKYVDNDNGSWLFNYNKCYLRKNKHLFNTREETVKFFKDKFDLN